MKRQHFLRLGALLVLLVSFTLLEVTKVSAPCANFDTKLLAAERTQACMEAVYQLKLERGVPINAAADINQTGLIGQDYSFITTTLGNLEAKRTSTNPNMAAIVVDMFTELKLQPGDKVAVNCSGSFPALNIAVICAIDVMGLDPVLYSSFGASTHGANDPELTWLDMEHYLYEQGLIEHKSRMFSIGGMLDMGLEMPVEMVEAIVERIKGYGYEHFYDEDLIHNVQTRYALYRETGEIKCFINVGGNDPAFGDSNVIVHSDGGILTKLPENDQSVGLVQLFLKDEIPVVHLLNIKTLAAEYGLPIDPSPLPEIGEGGVFSEFSYQKWIAALGLALAFVLLWLGRESQKKQPSRR